LGEPRLALSQYRLRDAAEKLKGAEVLLSNGLYKDSISRSYYAMFSAARALLAMEGLDSRKHSGVVSLFNRHFVKNGIVDKDLGRLIMNKNYRLVNILPGASDNIFTGNRIICNQLAAAVALGIFCPQAGV